ncbi:MAG: hypothetical protein ACFFG0_12180 [Candidatus Thorarchaeota archaeon]
MLIKQPSEWNINVKKRKLESGEEYWEMYYYEFVKDTEENKLALENTIKMLKAASPIMSKAFAYDVDFKEKEGFIGLRIKQKSLTLESIAGFIVSEFFYLSELGDFTLRDLFTAVLSSALKIDIDRGYVEDK